MTILRLPPAADPVVSVVMVTYGGWDWPLRSLAVLEEHTLVPFEVLLVDNASWDGTGELLEDLVGGATLIRNRRNLGFAGAANQAAERTRGAYLCFLNPDCLVTPGWFRPLREALARPGVAAAIPRFLDPAGRLQEAGSVVDRQGWTEAIGRGSDPDDPAYRFPRVVDYGSGACLLIRKDAFFEAGGFDPAFFPAYCEDVDLAFRLRERGLRTLLEPAASVVHAGTVSTDTTTRDRLIERNRHLLLRRWGERLAERPPLTELDRHPQRLVALRDALAPDRVLVLTGGAPAAAAELAARLASASPDVRVTLLSGLEEGLDELLAAGVEVVAAGEPSGWLEGRPFHYSVVVGADEPLEPALTRTQPQADRRSLAKVSRLPDEALLASVGAAPVLD